MVIFQTKDCKIREFIRKVTLILTEIAVFSIIFQNNYLVLRKNSIKMVIQAANQGGF